MKPLVTLLALAFLVVCTPHDAEAQHPRMIQTACDTLSHDPPLVRFTFAVENGDSQTAVGPFRLEPGGQCFSGSDSCCIRECAAPTSWYCMMIYGGEVPQWSGSDIAVGARIDGFSFVTDLHPCCYQAQFFASNAAFLWEESVCFTLDQPVTARAVSWGSLKAIYR